MSGAARAHGLVRFAPAALGVLGAALILLTGTRYGHGVGLTWDSANYVSAARSLVAGDGLVMWFGHPYPSAPLLPLLLAAAEMVGIDAIAAARYLNAAAFGLTVFAAAAWLKRRLRSPLLAVWAGCACALMPALIFAAARVWTETIFILFTMVSLALLDRFLSGRKAPALLLAAAAAAAAACLTRYVGATLIGAGALILLLRNDTGMRARIRDSALWSVVSLAPIGAWMVRNMQVFGALYGLDFGALPSDDNVGLISLHHATGEFALWLLGPTGFDMMSRAFGSVTGIDLAGPATVPAVAAKSVLLAAPALGAGYALARYRPGFLRANRTVLTVAIGYAAVYWLFLVVFQAVSERAEPVRYLLPLFPPLLVVATLALDGLIAKRSFTNAAPAKHVGPAAAVPVVVAIVCAAVYWLLLVVFQAVSERAEPVRYLLPLFLPPLLVVATLVLDGLIAKRSFTNAAPGEARRPAAAAVPMVAAIVMSLWLMLQAGAAWSDLRERMNNGAGYMSRDGIGSDLIRYLRANRLVGKVWSNEPPLLYFATGQRRLFTIRKSLAEVTEDLANEDPAESIYLVWFESSMRNHDYATDDLVALPGVELVADLDGGVILHRRPAIPAFSADHRVVRAYFDIHVYDDALAYFKEPCTEADVQADFFLHVTPAAAVDLSAAARSEGASFNSLDFSFAERGVIRDGRCLAVVTFDYEAAHLHTGQYGLGPRPYWEVETTL